jgi:uncharacterized protein YndB with AHSA1/START domain
MRRSKRQSILVSAPVDKVFTYLADLSRRIEWAQEKQVTITSPGPVRVGTTFKTVTEGPEYRSYSNYQVTEFVPGERLAWETESLGIRYRQSLKATAADGGTLVTMGSQMVSTGWLALYLWPFLLLSVYSPLARWIDARMLKRLKKWLESQA